MAESDRYIITDAQMRTIMRLSDAANLLTAALPPAYTTTPMGPLKALSDNVAAIAFTVKPIKEAECSVSDSPDHASSCPAWSQRSTES